MLNFLKNAFTGSLFCLLFFLGASIVISILILVFKAVYVFTGNPGLGVLAMIITFCLEVGVIGAGFAALDSKKPNA